MSIPGIRPVLCSIECAVCNDSPAIALTLRPLSPVLSRAPRNRLGKSVHLTAHEYPPLLMAQLCEI